MLPGMSKEELGRIAYFYPELVARKEFRRHRNVFFLFDNSTKKKVINVTEERCPFNKDEKEGEMLECPFGGYCALKEEHIPVFCKNKETPKTRFIEVFKQHKSIRELKMPLKEIIAWLHLVSLSLVIVDDKLNKNIKIKKKYDLVFNGKKAWGVEFNYYSTDNEFYKPFCKIHNKGFELLLQVDPVVMDVVQRKLEQILKNKFKDPTAYLPDDFDKELWIVIMVLVYYNAFVDNKIIRKHNKYLEKAGGFKLLKSIDKHFPESEKRGNFELHPAIVQLDKNAQKLAKILKKTR